MERRTVRIYKAQDGQGRYINKTAKFLQKAQMGAETRTDSVMKNKELEPVVSYINGALDNDVDPKKIYTSLVNEGLPQQLVYSVLTQLIQQREEEAEQSEEENASKNEQETEMPVAEYQPIGEEQQETEDETSSAMDYFNSYADEDEGSGVMDEEEYEEGGPVYSYDQLASNNDDSSEEMSPDVIEKLSALSDFVNKSKDDFSDFGKDIREYAEEYTPVEWDALGDGYGYYKKGGSKKNFTKNVLNLIKKEEGGGTEEIGRGNKKDTITDDIAKRKKAFEDKLKEIATKGAVDSIYEKMIKSNNPELIQSAQELAANRQKNSQMGTFEPVESAQSGGYVGEFQPELFYQGGFDIPEAKKGFIQKAGDFLLGEQYLTANNPYNVTTGALYKDPISGLTPIARTVHKRGILGRPKQWTDYYSKTQPLTPGQEIKAAYEKQLANAKNKDIAKKHGMTKEEWKSMPSEAKKAIRRGERKLNRELKRGEEMYADDKTFMSTPNLIPIQEFANYTEQINDVNGNRLKIPKLFEITKKLEPELSFEERMNMNDPEFYRSEAKEGPLVDNWSKEDYKILDERRAEADAIYQQALKNRTENEQELIGKQLEDYIQEYGSLMKYQIKGAVKSPTNNLSGASDPTANTGNLMGMLKPQENSNTFMSSSSSFMNQNVPVNKEAGNEKPIIMDPNQTKDQTITSDVIAQDVKRKRNFNGVNFNNKLNAAGNLFANILNKRDAARQEREMYENNFTADNIYTASSNKDRGDYVAYGQQTGMFRPDETGQQTSGRFAYGQMGGYMGDFNYDIDDEVDMNEDELREFLANGGEVEYLES